MFFVLMTSLDASQMNEAGLLLKSSEKYLPKYPSSLRQLNNQQKQISLKM